MVTEDPETYFESVYEEPDPWNFSESEYELEKYTRQIDLIRDHTDSVSDILEIGCAEGVHSQMLLEAFPQATLLGIELADSAAKNARNRLPKNRVKIASRDATDYIHEITQSFDAIVWSETIYYMGAQMTGPELYDYVDTLFDKLRSDGILVMANLPDQADAPEEKLTKPALMNAYRSILSGIGTEVHRSQHTDHKKESDTTQTYTYEMWGFKPPST